MPSDSVAVKKTFRETGLPWTIQIAVADVPAADWLAFASRRNLFAASFGPHGARHCGIELLRVQGGETRELQRRATSVRFRRRRFSRVQDTADGDVPSHRTAGRRMRRPLAALRNITVCWRRRAAGCMPWSKACSISAASNRGAGRLSSLDRCRLVRRRHGPRVSRAAHRRCALGFA